MKVILINPPLSMAERYGSLANAGSYLPPMGLCSLAAVARKEGLNVSIIDAPALGLNISDTFEEIKAFDPEIIGITAVTVSINNAAQLAQYVKERNIKAPIILGGPHVTAVPEETLSRFPEFDIAVIGEGEETFLELIKNQDELQNIENIKGIAFRDNGRILKTPLRPFIKNLDNLPLPAWDLLPDFPSRYSQSTMRSYRFPSACLITSRGCYGKCIFCDTSGLGHSIRKNSADYVITMIKQLIDVYGVKEIAFYDDNFAAFPSRISQICEKIISEKLDLTWSCDARIDSIRSSETLRMMKESGCWQICYGIESADQKILEEIKKNTNIDQIRQVVEWTAKAGIHVKGFFMMGHPLETEKTMKETIRFAKKLPLTNAHVTFVTPLPGTELFKNAHKYGKFNADWSKMNMWTPVFVPNGLNEELLQKYKKKFFKNFYLRPRIILAYLSLIKKPKQLFKMIHGFWILIRSLIKS